MGKKYANPPIVEAACEVRLTLESSDEDSKWDPAVPGLVYEKVKGEFPLRKRGYVQEITFLPSKPDESPKVQNNEVAVFLTEDKNTSIRVWLEAPRFSVRRSKPYQSWGEFKPKIQTALKEVMETVDVRGLSGISLRYLNQIEIPQKPVEVEDYFEFKPSLGDRLPQNTLDFIVGYIFPFEESRDLCKVQLTNGYSDKQNMSVFILDIDYMLIKPEEVPCGGTLEWIEGAHQKIEEIFEGCITDKSRELFQEVK